MNAKNILLQLPNLKKDIVGIEVATAYQVKTKKGYGSSGALQAT